MDDVLTAEIRKTVFDQVVSTVSHRFYEPAFHGIDWLRHAGERRSAALDCAKRSDFESAVQHTLGGLKASPLRFYHQSDLTIPFHKAAGATGRSVANGWMLQDVLTEGPAAGAGLEPGDVVTSIDGRPVDTEALNLPRTAASHALEVIKRSGESRAVELTGGPRPTKYVTHSLAAEGIGYIRVSMFPGLVGIDFAREVDRAIAALSHCRSLIIDLRGNPGGGSGNLRLMSYMTPDRVPVGYSLTRPRAQKGYRREELAQFRRIPSSKISLIWLALRFKFADKSIVVVTEGLGGRNFHSRIVLLVNEHTASGAEIVAGFAKEHQLAVIVGRRTAGRLLGWSTFRLEHDYRLVIPVSNYLTWEGKCFEGMGVTPDVEIDFSTDAAVRCIDNQMEKAREVAASL